MEHKTSTCSEAFRPHCTYRSRMDALLAISPVDGRYAAKANELRTICSEFGLIRYRVLVEIEWFLFLAGHDGSLGLPHSVPERCLLFLERQVGVLQLLLEVDRRDRRRHRRTVRDHAQLLHDV